MLEAFRRRSGSGDAATTDEEVEVEGPGDEGQERPGPRGRGRGRTRTDSGGGGGAPRIARTRSAGSTGSGGGRGDNAPASPSSVTLRAAMEPNANTNTSASVASSGSPAKRFSLRLATAALGAVTGSLSPSTAGTHTPGLHASEAFEDLPRLPPSRRGDRTVPPATNLTVGMVGGKSEPKRGALKLRRSGRAMFSRFRAVHVTLDNGVFVIADEGAEDEAALAAAAAAFSSASSSSPPPSPSSTSGSLSGSAADAALNGTYSLFCIAEVREPATGSSDEFAVCLATQPPSSPTSTSSTAPINPPDDFLSTSSSESTPPPPPKTLVFKAASNAEAVEWVDKIKAALQNQVLVVQHMLTSLRSTSFFAERAGPLFHRQLKLLYALHVSGLPSRARDIADAALAYGEWLCNHPDRLEEGKQLRAEAEALAEKLEEEEEEDLDDDDDDDVTATKLVSNLTTKASTTASSHTNANTNISAGNARGALKEPARAYSVSDSSASASVSVSVAYLDESGVSTPPPSPSLNATPPAPPRDPDFDVSEALKLALLERAQPGTLHQASLRRVRDAGSKEAKAVEHLARLFQRTVDACDYWAFTLAPERRELARVLSRLASARVVRFSVMSHVVDEDDDEDVPTRVVLDSDVFVLRKPDEVAMAKCAAQLVQFDLVLEPGTSVRAAVAAYERAFDEAAHRAKVLVDVCVL